MTNLLFLVFPFWLSVSSPVQDTTTVDREYQLHKTIDTQGRTIRSDNLGNCYLVRPNNELVKYNSDGEQQATFSIKKYGGLATIDCTNPLRLLLFYPDFEKIVLLDRHLSEQTSVDLAEMRIQETSAISTGRDNEIWIYDEQSYQLKKLDAQLNVKEQSEDLSMVLQPGLQPNALIAQGNRLYLNDPELGIFVFDQYGNYSRKIPIKGLEAFQLLDEKIYYYRKNKLWQYDPETVESKSFTLPDHETIKAVQIQQNRLYLLTEKQLLFYKF